MRVRDITIFPVRSLKILLVEDHATMNKVLTDYLRLQGHELVSCSGIEEALWAASGTQLDLVLCDLKLPDGIGWELADPFKKRRSAPMLVAMTAGPESEFKGPSLAAGFDHFLAKPFLPDDLDLLLKNCEGKQGGG